MKTKTIRTRRRFPPRLLLLAAAVILTATLFVGWEDAVPASSVRLYVESDREGEIYLCADPPLREVGQGAIALGMTVTLSHGGGWDGITSAEGAEGLTLTVGKVSEDGRTVKLLLDGVPTGDSHRLLRLAVSSPPDGRGVRVTIAEADGIYYIDPSGGIQKAPASAEGFSTEAGDDKTKTEAEPSDPPANPPADRPTGDPQDGEAEIPSEAESETGSETEAESEADAAQEPPSPVFAGCQETPVTDGIYAARFLFRNGLSGGTPVVCMAGGGTLLAETQAVIIEEERFAVCTFRGLRADVSYTFLVYTRDGVVEARYSDGKFLGYDTKPYPTLQSKPFL